MSNNKLSFSFYDRACARTSLWIISFSLCNDTVNTLVIVTLKTIFKKLLRELQEYYKELFYILHLNLLINILPHLLYFSPFLALCLCLCKHTHTFSELE